MGEELQERIERRELAAIVAMDSHRIIGAHGALPWHLPADLKRFAALTTGHAVMMGSTTWRSLPDRYRPLPRRANVVVTRSPELLAPGALPAGVIVCADPLQFANDWLTGKISIAKKYTPTQSEPSAMAETLWVIGGAKLYSTMMPLCSRVELTIVDGAFQGDTYLEPFEEGFDLVQEEESDGCKFQTLRRRA